MDPMQWPDVATILTAVAGAVTTVLAVLTYFARRDRRAAVQKAFRAVVDSLSSEVEGQRLGGAILLRRFFDPKTELGAGSTPYAREAVDVIAALLRGAPTGNFQKLLADGLLYAPSLESADLQRTNLQNAYLGRKASGAPNLRRADFYRADLSSASLKGADLSHAIFYQARLHNAVLKEAELSGASFFEADLLGANFGGANLTEATFVGARNVPEELAVHIDDDSRYRGPDRLPPKAQIRYDARTQVFVSKPGTLNLTQQELLRQVEALLAAENIELATVERKDYPSVGAVSEVRRVLSGCSGALILGFRQLEVSKGIWRGGTEEAKELQDVALPTSWNHLEAGMAAMVGLPILFLIERGVVGGLFELGDVGHVVANVDLAKLNQVQVRESIALWCHSVREMRPLPARVR
jgi:hypothetical protein